MLYMLSGEAANTNYKIFGLIQSRLLPRIYRTQGGSAEKKTRSFVYILQDGKVVALLSQNKNNKFSKILFNKNYNKYVDKYRIILQIFVTK
jgi:hypothetical protein